VVYCKSGAGICDCLALMGAAKAVLRLNSILVDRQMAEHLNRQQNCDLYNIDKQIDTGLRQCAHIRSLPLDTLTPALKDTAAARLQHPDYSYEQLAAALGISKSGLKNRLRRLEQMHATEREEGKMVFKETTVGRQFVNTDAQKLVMSGMRFDSEITLEMGTKKINAKSLMGVISLALRAGDAVTVIAKGDDQEAALDAVIKLLHASAL
jgi:phosphotransferase system HPr (HPr) family protein